jgi:two-component system OmpR family sensor kinase
LELALRRSRSRDELESALRSAAEESDRLSRLAEDLLVLTRAQHGQLPIRPSRASVQAILDRTVRAFENRASRKSITISRIDVDRVEAELDPDRIEQALSNLLDNALRHTPPGGRISVVTSIEGDTMSITVSDTGEGFSEPFLGQAFEAFARADGGRGRSEGGTGLGLAIVRAIAEAHGGSAMASNTEAGGASIRLELPLYGPPM